MSESEREFLPTRAEAIEAVADAMQDAWDDFCGDAHTAPDCFSLRGKEVWADFERGNFVPWVTDRLVAAGMLAVAEEETRGDS